MGSSQIWEEFHSEPNFEDLGSFHSLCLQEDVDDLLQRRSMFLEYRYTSPRRVCF